MSIKALHLTNQLRGMWPQVKLNISDNKES